MVSSPEGTEPPTQVILQRFPPHLPITEDQGHHIQKALIKHLTAKSLGKDSQGPNP